MLAPLRSGSGRTQVSTVRVVPPPTGGWNARDDITDMKADEALVLDNFIPGDGAVTVRSGYVEWATDVGAPITRLMEYSSAAAAPKLFAATATDIFDVTDQGAVGTAAVSSLTAGTWSHTMFATAGGTFLVAANGSDDVLNFDGSIWTTPTITNVTSANLIQVTAHQSRLWFVEKNSSKVWYLPTLAIAGAATAIDFAGLSRHGGKLIAMGSWTRDSGAGIEDLAVFIMSTGETHIYAGSDPSSSDTWARVGTFKLPEPIGRNCMIKVGGDLGILTSQGLVPLSGILSRAEAAQGKVAITDIIRNAFTEAYRENATLDGWQVIEYPLGKLLVINVPDSNGNVQFVMNANTGKWCRFTGLLAGGWSLLGDELCFGASNGTVYKYGRSTDDGNPINAASVSAFNDFGTVRTKSLRRILPRFSGLPGYRPSVGVRIDYDDDAVMSGASQADAPGTAWDEGAWDSFAWAGGQASNKRWQALNGEATVAAVAIAVSQTEPFTYTGAKIEFEAGDHL